MEIQKIKPGIYKHYKGKEYKVLMIGVNTESLEKQVVYQALYNDEHFGNNAIWIRPLSMFCETITFDDKEVPRFIRINS